MTLKFGWQSLGICLAIAALGYFPTVRLAGPDSVVAMLGGIGVSLAGSWAGAVPVILSRNKANGLGPANTVLASMVVRFFVVLALALSIALSGKLDRAVFLIWVGISYLALLAADTNFALKAAAESTRKDKP